MTDPEKNLVVQNQAASSAAQPAPAIVMYNETEQTTKYYAPNDAGNAERLLDACGENVRYCTAEKTWYVFDGICWRADMTCQVEKWRVRHWMIPMQLKLQVYRQRISTVPNGMPFAGWIRCF